MHISLFMNRHSAPKIKTAALASDALEKAESLEYRLPLRMTSRDCRRRERVMKRRGNRCMIVSMNTGTRHGQRSFQGCRRRAQRRRGAGVVLHRRNRRPPTVETRAGRFRLIVVTAVFHITIPSCGASPLRFGAAATIRLGLCLARVTSGRTCLMCD